MEAHYGLLQIAEALNFLHNDVKMMHGNLMLNNILISRHGDWKLAGFNFASFVQYQTTAQVGTVSYLFSFKKHIICE